MTTLEQLPDDVLVAVMQYLSVDDLFACRVVCKGLGDVALHKDVWRHKRLLDHKPKPCACAVLRVAPCLNSAVFSYSVHTSAFAKTSCAVRELVLRGWELAEITQAEVALRNQEALGRLRRVEFMLNWEQRHTGFDACEAFEEKVPPSRAQLAASDRLLKKLLLCSGLESIVLSFRMSGPYTFTPVLDTPSRSSLKHFRCKMSREVEPFVKAVLASHAATLEKVDLSRWGAVNAGEVGRLIVGLPGLRSLVCEMFPGMQNLTACNILQNLSIYIRRGPSASDVLIEEAAELVRRAERLGTFSIKFEDDGEEDIVAPLLRALASSGKSQVERLTLISIDASMQLLLRALPRLPALRQLVLSRNYVDDDTIEDLLLGITPSTAPALRRLELEALGGRGRTGCAHAWLHGDEIRSFLTVNPLIHVHVRNINTDCDAMYIEDDFEAEGSCEFCDLDSGMCNMEWQHQLGLFSHGPNDCPSPEDHITGSSWTWINMHGGSS